MYSFELMLKPANRLLPTPLSAMSVRGFIMADGVKDQCFIIEPTDERTAMIFSRNPAHLRRIRQAFRGAHFYTGPIVDDNFQPRRGRVA